MIVINNENFFSSYEIDNLRTSQKKIIELAEKALLEGNYDEAKSLYSTVKHTVHNEDLINKINTNINNIEKLKRKKEDEKNKLDFNSPVPNQSGSSIPFSGSEGLNLRIDNITISGLNIDATGKAVELIKKALNISKGSDKNTEENSKDLKESKSCDSQLLSDSLLTEGVEVKSVNVKDDFGETGQIEDNIGFNRDYENDQVQGKSNSNEYKNVRGIENTKNNVFNLIEREVIKEKSVGVDDLKDDAISKSKSVSNVADTEKNSNTINKVTESSDVNSVKMNKDQLSGKGDFEKDSSDFKNKDTAEIKKENIINEKDIDIELEKIGDENVELEKIPEEREEVEEKNRKLEILAKLGDEPIKIEPTLKPPPEKIMKPIELTYNFVNIFHNKFYFKYENLFEDAAKLVKENKLDEAIEYYKVILDQKIPETLKIMIKANIEELQKAILNTFKKTDTMVTLDYSGKLVSIEDKIKLEGKSSGAKSDIYFKEI